MTTYSLLEPLLVGLIVAASLLFSLRRLAPHLCKRLAGYARKAGVPARIASLFSATDKGCESGCGCCAGCDPHTASHATLQPVTVHRRTSHS